MDYLFFVSSLTLFGISMCFTPGPNNALAMATGMSRGFRAALPFCIGAAVGANISLVLLGLGLGALFTRLPVLYDILRWLGAIYMIWLAWRISGLRLPDRLRRPYRSGETGPQPVVESAARQKGREDKAGDKAMRPLGPGQAMLLQLVNVKVWITNVVIVSSYVGAGPDRWTRFCLAVALFTVLGGTAMSCWAAGGVVMRRFLSSDGMRRANLLFAAFLLVSVALLFA